MGTDQIQRERELFERYIKGRAPGANLQRIGDEYIDLDVQLHFETWLARANMFQPASPVVQHSDDAAVDRFAAAMKEKLAAARAKGRAGWDDPNVCSVETLAKLLISHLRKGNAGTFEDVANFAMMLHQRGADPKVLADAAAPVAQAEQYGSYVTTPGESVAGIAARQLGDQSRWIEIRDLNAHASPDMGPHDYYPVGTKLVMPKSAPPAQHDASVLVEALESAIKAFEEIQGGCATDRDICREEAAKIRAALAGKGATK